MTHRGQIIDQQQFFQTRSEPQQQFFQARQTEQKDVSYFIHELKDRVGKGENTAETWGIIFGMVNMKSTLSDKDKELFHEIFSAISRSPDRIVLIYSFMEQVRRSTLKHPRITKNFLRQIFPIGRFTKSIHKYSHLSLIGPIIDYIRFLLFQPPTKKFQKQLVQFIGDCQKKKNISVINKLEKRLPPHIRSDFQKFLRDKQAAQTIAVQQQQKQPTQTIVVQQQKQQKLSQHDIVNKINAIILRRQHASTPMIQKFIKIVSLLSMLSETSPEVRDSVYAMVQQQFLKQNKITPQRQVFYRLLGRRSSHFKQVQKKMDDNYRRQTERLLQQARQNREDIPLELLTIIALLGAKDQMTENDFKFVFTLLMDLKNKNDPRWELFFEKTRKVVLKKARTILQQKNKQQGQINQTVDFINNTLENLKKDRKASLLWNRNRINKTFQKLGFRSLMF